MGTLQLQQHGTQIIRLIDLLHDAKYGLAGARGGGMKAEAWQSCGAPAVKK